MTLSRRSLLASSTAGSFMALTPGVRVAFGADAPAIGQNTAGQNIVVSLFLRFGMDGLQLLAPAIDGNYRDKRPFMGVESEGLAAGYHLGALNGTQLFLHPRAGGLKRFYDDKKLAFVHAAGVPTTSRSHFKDQDMLDKGMADFEPDPNSGWLARHMNALAGDRGDFDAVVNGFGQSPSLVGFAGAVSFADVGSFGGAIYGPFAEVLGKLNAGEGELRQSAQRSLAAIEGVRAKLNQSGFQTPEDAGYTFGALSQRLRPLAQLLKLDLGVRAATVDFGGWDHHDFLVESFGRQADELARALTAFMRDLGPLAERVTVVAYSEFGRRVEENGNGGTEHGAGGVMMVLGGGVAGGRIYGEWPGLAPRDLDEGDLRVTTDYRRVLSEVLVKRHGQAAIESVFPTIPYRPLGIMI
ncbi:MAG: DUF1501 domain-containing protein [Rhodospirillaceae bacterium]|nr:DUF1501 domain-containing protein [Rhodospirillaceae bacterium]